MIRLPHIGKFKKGEKKSTGKNGKVQPGRDLKHFRVVFAEEFASYAPVFAALYGPEPSVIPGVRFLEDNPFTFFYERWFSNEVIQTRHDGKVYVKRWTPEGYVFGGPVSEEDLDPKVCKPSGRLVFFLEDFFQATGVVGLFTATTSSEYDRDTLQSYLMVMRAMGIPLINTRFTLRRIPHAFTEEIGGKPSKVVKYMLQLEADPDMVRAALPSRTDPITGEITGGNHPALPSGAEPRTLTQDELVELYDYTRDTLGLSKTDLMLALDVSDIRQWLHADPLGEAKRRLDIYLDARISRHADSQDQSDAVTDDGETFQPALLDDDAEQTKLDQYQAGL